MRAPSHCFEHKLAWPSCLEGHCAFPSEVARKCRYVGKDRTVVSEDQSMTQTCLPLPSTGITVCVVLSKAAAFDLSSLFSSPFPSFSIFFLSSHLFSSGKGTWLVMMHNCLGSWFRRHGAPLTCQTTAVAMWLPLLCSFRRPAGIYSIFSKQGILPEVHSGESTSGNSHWEVRVKDFIIKKPQTNNKKHKTPNAVSFQVIL